MRSESSGGLPMNRSTIGQRKRLRRSSRAIAVLALGCSFTTFVGAVVFLFDPFTGGATVGIVNGVTFSATTAVFDSHGDGIEYTPSLFPAQGAMEVVLKLNEPPRSQNADSPTGFFPASTILDSAGADARVQGDIFLFVTDTGVVKFTLAPVGGVNPSNQVQVVSTTSILDEKFHAIAVCYGTGGIRLYIDGVLQATDPFIGLRNVNRAVALGDFTDRTFSDALYGFSFIGEVDAIRTSDVCDPSLTPPAASNRPPIADAGSDLTVNEAETVTLNGSGSTDPDGDPLTYQWGQVAGTSVLLNAADPIRPTFSAPLVVAGGETLTFLLTVADGKGHQSDDFVNVTVKNQNRIPSADAGPDQTVSEFSIVKLDGSSSFDPDGESLTYSWMQVGGQAVSLSNANQAITTFTAPSVVSTDVMLTFQLTVSDGIDVAANTVTVRVQNVNHAPTADAGPDRSVEEGSVVIFDATHSSDPDGDALNYAWMQVSGPPVVLSASNVPAPSFVAPQVMGGGAVLEFSVAVSDGFLQATDSVVIRVLDLNDPPQCGSARASDPVLWPPNHKLRPVAVLNVFDPNNDDVTVAITGVTQDEPVNGLGDGDTSPDAVMQGDKVLLRAERSGTGNGRVYRVYFSATDTNGATCSGSILVAVPHSRDRSAIDDGQTVDSTR
jgi:hypothetical protein